MPCHHTSLHPLQPALHSPPFYRPIALLLYSIPLQQTLHCHPTQCYILPSPSKSMGLDGCHCLGLFCQNGNLDQENGTKIKGYLFPPWVPLFYFMAWIPCDWIQIRTKKLGDSIMHLKNSELLHSRWERFWNLQSIFSLSAICWCLFGGLFWILWTISLLFKKKRIMWDLLHISVMMV